MSDNTPRLGIPYIVASQAQKEVTHNEAMNMLDVFVQPAIQYYGSNPPATLIEGFCYAINGTGVTGAWVGHANQIAQVLGGAWVFYTPSIGMTVWDIAGNYHDVWNGSSWLINHC